MPNTDHAAVLAGPHDPTRNGFDELGVPAAVVTGLAERNIVTPTEVQQTAIPVVRQGRDVIVQAKTGTGKTLAFGLPLLSALDGPGNGKPRVLVVTPTRELCSQVASDLATTGEALGIRCVAVYGGQGFEPQIAALQSGVDIVVGTPGRLLDLSRRKELELQEVLHVVLDEADEMLNMGFLPDVQRLLGLAKHREQTLMFSATMPTEVRALARGFMKNPTFISVAGENHESRTVAGVTQHAFQTHNLDKPEVLARILQAEGRGGTVVFCRTKMTAQRVADELVSRGFKARAIHGDLSQQAREDALESFRSRKSDVLVATDVAARGIDIDGVTHVVNYQTPEDAATYLHRIGRTARAGRSGTAVTFVDWDMVLRWNLIAKEIGLGENTLLELYSSSPELYQLLGIPSDAKGRLLPARTSERNSRRDSYNTVAGQRGRSEARNKHTTRRSTQGDDRQAKGSTTTEPGAKRGPRQRSRKRTRRS